MKQHFFALIQKATTTGQIKAIVQAMDECFREDPKLLFQPEDYKELSRLVARRRVELDLPF